MDDEDVYDPSLEVDFGAPEGIDEFDAFIASEKASGDEPDFSEMTYDEVNRLRLETVFEQHHLGPQLKLIGDIQAATKQLRPNLWEEDEFESLFRTRRSEWGHVVGYHVSGGGGGLQGYDRRILELHADLTEEPDRATDWSRDSNDALTLAAMIAIFGHYGSELEDGLCEDAHSGAC